MSQFTLPSTAPEPPAGNVKEPKTKANARRKSTMQKEPKPGSKGTDKKKKSKLASGDSSSSSSKRCYKKRRTEGLEGFLAAGPTIDEAIAAGLIPPLPEGDTKEIRKQRRLIRNRVSAQLHRERKKLYVENLETRVQEQADIIDDLEAQIEKLNAALAAARENQEAKHNHLQDSTNGTLSNPSSAKRQPKSIRLMGRSSPLRSEECSAGRNNNQTSAGTDVDTDRISSDSSVSDSESNDANMSGSDRRVKRFKPKRQLSLKVDAGETSADLMNAPLLATPTGEMHANNPNPRKRAFFMMGMFLFTALFGGSIVNLSKHNLHDGRHLLSFSKADTMATNADSVVPLHHYRHHGRHLMSVGESDYTSVLPAESVHKATPVSARDQQEASSSALWDDLVDMPVNGTGTCLAANLLSSVSSTVNASQVLAKGKLFPRPKTARNAAATPKKLRGVEGAVVPYTDMTRANDNEVTQSGATRALSSVMSLQQHMQAAMAGPTQNASTILCPKPYGLLGANMSHTLDDNLVLLLPSSSVSQVINAVRHGRGGKDSAKSTSSASSRPYEWDGTWVEVDATITAIRQIPMYGGKLAGETSRAILL